MSNIKVIEKRGEKGGKTAVILAGVHGNEICGVKAFDKIIPSIKIKSGKVFFIYSNLEAIRQDKRFVEENLNRRFLPESKKVSQTLESKTAEEIKPYLDEADFLLDVHASNSLNSIPFVISDKNSLELANAMPCDIVSLGWDSFQEGSTDYYMHLNNKGGICFESGSVKDLKSITRAENAIINFLSGLELIDGAKKRIDKKKYFNIISIYKNPKYSFQKSRDFTDFEILKRRTWIGTEGSKKIFLDANLAVLFVRSREKSRTIH